MKDEINVFEISPFKFNVKISGEKWQIMYLKYDPDSDIFPEIFFREELRTGLFNLKVTNKLDTPKKRCDLLELVLAEDIEFSHAGRCGN